MIAVKTSQRKSDHLIKTPEMALPPPLLKVPQIANKLSVVLFPFDCFSEYPLSIFRRYSEKRSKAVARFCDFPQNDGKKPELFTKNSHLAGNGTSPVPRPGNLHLALPAIRFSEVI